MLIQDSFVTNFYNVIKCEHTLVLINEDVDAICASMILLHAFSCDDVHFTAVPVNSIQSISKALEDYTTCKHVVMVNCGGYFCLTDPDSNDICISSDLTVFVIDSKRPFNLDNIYNNGNVRILVRSSEVATWEIPKIEEIYDNDDSESSDDESNDRVADIEQRMLKKQTKINWDKKRSQLLWEYYNQTYYADPSSIFLLNLVHDLNMSNVKTVWCAATGLCSQLADHLISSQTYMEQCLEYMKPFISKYGKRNNKDKKSNAAEDVMAITFEKDLMLPLYTNWTLKKALAHDVGFSCKNMIWSQKGTASVHHTLASIGITLEEFTQSFNSLKAERKRELFEILYKYLEVPFLCFQSHSGYAPMFSAMDFARVLALRLEFHNPHSTETLMDRYTATNELIHSFFKSTRYSSHLNGAIDEYKLALEAIKGLVFNVLNQGLTTTQGSNYYLVTLDQSIDASYLSSRHCFNSFLFFVLCGFVRNKKKLDRPLFGAVPSQLSDENNRYWTITGIMPFYNLTKDLSMKTWIPMVMKTVCDKLKNDFVRNSLDFSVIDIKHDDKNRFFDELDIVLRP